MLPFEVHMPISSGNDKIGEVNCNYLYAQLTKKEYGGILLFSKNVVEHTLSIKNDIGGVFDDLHVPERLDVTQLDKIMKKDFKKWDYGYYFERLAQVKIPERKKVKDFSREMRMKLFILDEPTNGLDPILFLAKEVIRTGKLLCK